MARAHERSSLTVDWSQNKRKHIAVASCSVALIKHSGKSSLWRKGWILAHSLSWQGRQGSRRMNTVVIVRKQEHMHVSAQLTFIKFRIPSYSGILSPIKISLLTLVNKIKIIPYRQAQRSSL